MSIENDKVVTDAVARMRSNGLEFDPVVMEDGAVGELAEYILTERGDGWRQMSVWLSDGREVFGFVRNVPTVSVPVFHCAAGCGYPVEREGDTCGECSVEDDCSIW